MVCANSTSQNYHTNKASPDRLNFCKGRASSSSTAKANSSTRAIVGRAEAATKKGDATRGAT